MCGACGVLGGGPDWIDRADNRAGIGPVAGQTRAAERQRRVRLVNMLLRAGRSQVVDTGSILVLRSPTGRTEVVDSLAHVWTAVEKVGMSAVDPLDERVLAQLQS